MTNRSFALVAVLELLGIAVPAAVAPAAPVVFTDRVAFEAGGGVTFTTTFFDTTTTDTFLSPTAFDAGPFTVGNVSNTAPGRSRIDAAPFIESGDLAPGPRTYLVVNLASTAASNFETVTLTFDNPIRAVGFDLNAYNFDPSSTDLGEFVQFSTSAGESGQFQLPLTDVTEFRGFVTTSPFTSVTFSRNSGSDDEITEFGVDIVTTYTTYVPEPSSAAALAAAIALTGSRAAGRRSRGGTSARR